MCELREKRKFKTHTHTHTLTKADFVTMRSSIFIARSIPAGTAVRNVQARGSRPHAVLFTRKGNTTPNMVIQLCGHVLFKRAFPHFPLFLCYSLLQAFLFETKFVFTMTGGGFASQTDQTHDKQSVSQSAGVIRLCREREKGKRRAQNETNGENIPYRDIMFTWLDCWRVRGNEHSIFFAW